MGELRLQESPCLSFAEAPWVRPVDAPNVAGEPTMDRGGSRGSLAGAADEASRSSRRPRYPCGIACEELQALPRPA